MKPRKQIVLEESEAPELSVADRIKILKAKLADPSTPASAMAGINRQISALEHDVVPGTYVRVGATGVEAVEKRKLLKTPPPEPKRVSTPLWVLRAELVESVADRLQLRSLLPEEIEIDRLQSAQLTAEQVLRLAKNLIWDRSHSDELRELQESFREDHPELALPVNTPGHWISYLKAYPRVTVNAGPALTPEELLDVETYRARARAAREETRRVIYEKYPDRFLGGFKTCAEYDAHHPGTRITSQRRPEFSEFPHERWV